MRWLLIFATLVVMLPLFGDDIIQRVGSDTQVLKVEAIGTETYKEVSYKLGGTFQKMSADTIIDIKRDKASLVYQSAEDLRSQGNYAEALKKYEAVLAREDAEAWEKVYAGYYKAFCLRMLGTVEPAKFRDAIKSFKEFEEKNKEHRLVPFSLLGRGIAAIGAGDWGEATDAFTKLSSGEYGSYWKVIGKYWLGEIGYRKNELENAIRIWAEIVTEADRMGIKDVRAKYELVLALREIEKGNLAKAEQGLSKIVEMGLGGMEPTVGYEVMAKAHKGLGDCYYKEAGSDKAKMRQALFEYLKVILLYSLSKPEYIHSLQMAIEISKKLGTDDDIKRVDELNRELLKAKGS